MFLALREFLYPGNVTKDKDCAGLSAHAFKCINKALAHQRCTAKSCNSKVRFYPTGYIKVGYISCGCDEHSEPMTNLPKKTDHIRALEEMLMVHNKKRSRKMYRYAWNMITDKQRDILRTTFYDDDDDLIYIKYAYPDCNVKVAEIHAQYPDSRVDATEFHAQYPWV